MSRWSVSALALAALLSGCAGGDPSKLWKREGGDVARASSAALAHPDPVWTSVAAMATGRESHTATLLGSGNVLVAGGFGSGYVTGAELYDPIRGKWTATGSMATGRAQHAAVLLGSDKVLVVGGFGVAGRLASAELYDPATGTWSATGPLSAARYQFTATLLGDGKVLVVGGRDADPLQNPMTSAELYDPATGTWSATGSLATARCSHSATLLPSGRVLVTGGSGTDYLASAEIYDPATGTWSATGALAAARSAHAAALLASGKVLVAGGLGTGGARLGSAELFDPATETWSETGSLASPRIAHTATALPTGKALVVGGYGAGYLASTELFDPVGGTWSGASSLATARQQHAATLLPAGRVLVTGGFGSLGYIRSAELYAAPNVAPVAQPQSVSTSEDVPVTIALSAVDAEDDPLTYAVTVQPEHGTLSMSGASLTYTPAADYGGSDSFGFIANDGVADSAAAIVTIWIAPVNDAPVVQGGTISMDEDGSATITLAGADADGDPLTFAIVTQPGHGSVALSGATATYTPAADYGGADSFGFIANDGVAGSAPAIVTISIAPVNDPPVVQGGTISMDEDGSATITLAGTDAEGAPLTFAIVTRPGHGSIALSGATATYTPAAEFNGTDGFTFAASDGTAASAAASVSIAVAAVNDAPVAQPRSVTTDEDVAVEITLAATDVDADSLTYAIVTQPAHGTVTVSGATVTYTPAAGFDGTDAFTFTASDGTAASGVETVTIGVARVDEPKAGGCSCGSTGDGAPLGALLLAMTWLRPRRRPGRAAR